MGTKPFPRKRQPRVVVVASDAFRRASPRGWMEDLDCRWHGAGVAAGDPDDAAGRPDYWVAVNAPVAPAESARHGVLDVRIGLRMSTGVGRRANPPTLVASVHWRAVGAPSSVLVHSTTAPVHPFDTRLCIVERGNELGLHALRTALGRVMRGIGQEPDAEDDSGPPPARPLVQRKDVTQGLAALHLARRFASQLRPRSLAKRLFLLVALLLFRPIRDFVRTASRRHPVRIFTFHRVTDLSRDSLTASRRTFEAQLRYIRRTHEVVTLEAGLRLVSGRARLRRPVAVLTFDDAYRSVYDFAAPAMADLGLSGCCFAPTAYVGSNKRFPWDEDSPVRDHFDVMTWDDLRRLQERGWTIGAHTHTHARLSECDDASLRRELKEPLDLLRARLQVDRVAMAYPFGGPDDMDQRGLQLAEALGYSSCLSNHGGENRRSPSPYRLARIDIGGDLDLHVWKGRVHGIETTGWIPRGHRPKGSPPPRDGDFSA